MQNKADFFAVVELNRNSVLQSLIRPSAKYKNVDLEDEFEVDR